MPQRVSHRVPAYRAIRGPAFLTPLLFIAVILPAQKPKTASPPPQAPVANFTDIAEKSGLTMQNIFGGVDTKNTSSKPPARALRSSTTTTTAGPIFLL